MIRYGFVLFVSLVLFSGVGFTLAKESHYDLLDRPETEHQSAIPTINDIFVEALAAKKSQLPLLIMFGADDCGYCEKLEAEVLMPMYISGEYHEKVIMRRVLIDGFEALRDFKGAELDASEFANKYHVTVTPTVMLFDSDGEMLVPKIIGINTVEFYGAYLDEAIDESYAKLNK